MVREIQLCLFILMIGVYGPRDALAQAPAQVPMKPGVNFVLAVFAPPESVMKNAGVLSGDYEMVVTLNAIDAKGISQTAYFDGTDEAGRHRRGSVPRVIRSQDIARGSVQVHGFHTTDPVVIPDTTSLGPSLAFVRRLVDHGEAPYAFRMFANGDVISGTLRRSAGKVDFPVLINGKRTQLSALHASGHLELKGVRSPFEMIVLDDPQHPLALRIAYGARNEGFPFKPRFAREIARIDYPEEVSLAEGLEKDCRVEVPGLYFDFNRDTLKPQSARALQAIAEALRSESTRSVIIEGHTDDVGTDVYNDDLSRRRATTVRTALVSGYDIKVALLTAQGFGERRPIESNATIAGRARNRRVEIACSPSR